MAGWRNDELSSLQYRPNILRISLLQLLPTDCGRLEIFFGTSSRVSGLIFLLLLALTGSSTGSVKDSHSLALSCFVLSLISVDARPTFVSTSQRK